MRARLINENIGDILVPKSGDEIKKNLTRFSGDRLWDLWIETGKKEYLQWAARKRINDVNEDDLAEALIIDESLGDVLFPHIIKNFPLELKKEGNKFYIYIDWWDELAFLFEDTNDLSVETIETILSGENSYDLFDRFGDPVDLHDIIDYIKIMEKNKGEAFFNDVTQELKEKMLEDNADVQIQNLQKLSELIKYMADNKTDFSESRDAVKNAVNETQTIADESKAMDDLKNAIKSILDISDLNDYHDDKTNSYRVPLSKANILTIFKMKNDVIDKIRYYPPSYGWSGYIPEHPEMFKKALLNRLSDI